MRRRAWVWAGAGTWARLRKANAAATVTRSPVLMMNDFMPGNIIGLFWCFWKVRCRSREPAQYIWRLSTLGWEQRLDYDCVFHDGWQVFALHRRVSLRNLVTSDRLQQEEA